MTTLYSSMISVFVLLFLARIISTWFHFFLLFTFRLVFLYFLFLYHDPVRPVGTCVTSEHHLGVYESLRALSLVLSLFFSWTGPCIGIRVYYEFWCLPWAMGIRDFVRFSVFGKRKIITIDNGNRIQEQMPIFQLFSFLITTFHIQVSRSKS